MLRSRAPPMSSRTRTHTKQTTLGWLLAPNRNGIPRIRTLSWGRLNRIYNARSATPAVRQAIAREARLCGYRPASILSLNAWT